MGPPDRPVRIHGADDVTEKLRRWSGGDPDAIDPRRTPVVEMRYFAGMTVGEIASVLGVPDWDVKKNWTLAKTWLKRHLRDSR
jgi:hypothetical protein